MFQECSSLKELNLSNFNTNNLNVRNMDGTIIECSSLKELNLSNDVCNMNKMFLGCSYDLKKKIKEKYKNINI